VPNELYFQRLNIDDFNPLARFWLPLLNAAALLA
jgi:hypothetical protein